MSWVSEILGGPSGAPFAQKSYKAQQAAIPQEMAALTGGTNQAIQSLMSGQGQAAGAYQAGMAPYQTLGSESAGFLPMYASALGVGDPSLAQGAFQASPGYQYTLGQGLEGLRRAEAGTGQQGQTLEDAMRFAQNLSDQDYMNWLNNLFRGVGEQNVAAGGVQRGYGQLGDLYGRTAGDIAGLQSQLGQEKAGLYGQQAQNVSNLQQQLYGNQANQYRNTLAALFGLGELGVGAYGAMNPATSNPLSAYSYDPTWSNTTVGP